jgi:putative membrane protein insertion efficiency factor
MPKRPPSSRKPSICQLKAEIDSPGSAAGTVIFLVRAYQLVLAPVLPRSCRFEPTCSSFAIQAVEVHGAAEGLRLAVRRLLRCHPWGTGGYDPVPARRA